MLVSSALRNEKYLVWLEKSLMTTTTTKMSAVLYLHLFPKLRFCYIVKILMGDLITLGGDIYISNVTLFSYVISCSETYESKMEHFHIKSILFLKLSNTFFLSGCRRL